MKNKKGYHKIKPIRMSEKTWEKFRKIRPRGISWNNFIEELIKLYER